MKTFAIGSLLLCSTICAGFDQNLFDLEVQEAKYRRNMLWNQDADTLRQILAIWTSRLGGDSLGVAQYSSRLGSALIHTGDYPAAEQALQMALSILESNGPAYGEAATLVKRKLLRSLEKQDKTEEADRLKNTLPPPRLQVQTDSPARVISKEEPQYTRAAAAKDVSGFISISLSVDETGQPKDIRVIEPLGFGLDESAIEAVHKWRFKPAIRSGVPVASDLTIEVSFRHF